MRPRGLCEADEMNLERLLLKWSVMSICGLALLPTFGCVIGPPLVNEDPINNHAPHIAQETIRPAEQPYVASSSDPIPLSILETYDEDEEDRLYYAFYASEIGILEEGSLDPRAEDTSLYRGVYRRYEDVSIDFNPCTSDLTGLTSVTVFFYLADRDWVITGLDGVIPEDDAFVTTHAWVIDLSNTPCN